MSTLGDAITDAIRRRQKKVNVDEDDQAVQDYAPEDMQKSEEEKNKRFARIKQMLGFGSAPKS